MAKAPAFLAFADIATVSVTVGFAGTTAYQFAWGAPWDFLAFALVRLLCSLETIYRPFRREFINRWHKLYTLGIVVASVGYALIVMVVRLLSWTPPVEHRASNTAVLTAVISCVLFSFCLKKCNASRIKEERLIDEPATEEQEQSKKVGLKFFLDLMRQERILLAVASVFLVCAAICQVLLPHYISMTINTIAKAGIHRELSLPDKKYDVEYPLTMLLGVGTLGAVCSACRGCTFIIMGARVSKRLRMWLFRSILHQELGFFDATKSGELSSRLTQDCQKISDQVTLNANVLFRALIQVVTTLAFMFYLNRKLTFLAFLSVPFVVLVSRKFGKYMKDITKKGQDALAEANSQAGEALTTMSTVKAFAAEEEEILRVDKKLVEYQRLMRRYGRNYLVYCSTVQFLPNAMSCLVLAYGGKLAISAGEVDSQVLMTFVFYLQTLNDSFSTMGDMYTNVMQAFGSASRVHELIAREPEDARLRIHQGQQMEYDGEKELPDLVFEDVTFQYPARPDVWILQGLSLRLKAGQVSALVGPSGGGKSTVMALLQNWYAPSSGRVLLGNTEISDLDYRWHKKIMSIVAQEPCLFGRTIRDNILYGTDGQGDVEAAARLAAAHDFISSLPDGYETDVGEKGVQLSGGQKQRIAITRALVREPKILLLDEATSALDTQSERVVQDALDQLISTCCGLQVVVIAHRLTTIRNADSIYVIDGGKLVEHGSHDMLITLHGGVYKNLVKLQSGMDLPPTPAGSATQSPKSLH